MWEAEGVGGNFVFPFAELGEKRFLSYMDIVNFLWQRDIAERRSPPVPHESDQGIKLRRE